MISVDRQIPWARVVVEGVVIVASILLAFGIDAWWEGRGEDAQREALLIGLAADFEVAEADLDRVLGNHQRVLDASARLMRLARSDDRPAELIPVVDSLVSELVFGGTFDPPTGTLDALVASGNVGVLGHPGLVRDLNEWSVVAGDLLRLERQAYAFVESQLTPYLRRRLRTADLLSSPRYEGVAVPWEAERTNAYLLLEDVEFDGLVSDRWFQNFELIQWGQRTREIQERVQALIDTELNDGN